MNPLVYLIGAGPGDPELLTLRGARCLELCDVVLYDGLSNVEILRMAPNAEHICVGKHGQSRIWKQQEIIDEMLRHVALGKIVARLKGGDPAVFARTAEEVDALNEAGIAFEIVPGITAALAAGFLRGDSPSPTAKLASAVALVTGHEEPDKPQSTLDWDALAKFPGTLVIYMGVTTAKSWTETLIGAGKDPATPVALVRRCSHPDQSSIHCRLDQVADRLTPSSKFRPPVIAIIGAVSKLAESMNWIHRRPLHGKSILVTRPFQQASDLSGSIRDLGGTPLVAPAIEIKPLDDYSLLDESFKKLPQTGLLIFLQRQRCRVLFSATTRASSRLPVFWPVHRSRLSVKKDGAKNYLNKACAQISFLMTIEPPRSWKCCALGSHMRRLRSFAPVAEATSYRKNCANLEPTCKRSLPIKMSMLKRRTRRSSVHWPIKRSIGLR